ncbi:MAG: radical SAM protein [Thermoprotei archaeon]|nr:MAG: radical SAM protein [Thermoprotei archaeon]
MKPEEALDPAETSLEEVLATSRRISWANFGKKLLLYTPSFIYYEISNYRNVGCPFPSFSVTGDFCALRCEHCDASLLTSMIPTITPDALFEACKKVKEKGGRGVLVSGGCLSNGRVPLERFLETIAKIKKQLGLTVVVHTGLVSEEVAKGLAEAGVDGALLDIIGDEETIKQVYHLKASVKDYEESLTLLERYKVPMIPHVLVGLHYGELRGELRALKIIAEHNPSAVVVIALIPLPGTPMENVSPPSPSSVVRVLAAARLMMPNVPLALGCARPKGDHRNETDKLAIEAGVNAIAFPSERALEKAKAFNLSYVFLPTCCSQVYIDVNR